jgi:hypothetical protein
MEEINKKPRNNTIIKFSNNIENYIFNNINISTEDNKMPLSLNLETKSVNLKKSQHKIEALDAVKKLHSASNSLNSLNSSTTKNIFADDNLSSRKLNTEMDECSKKNFINLKPMQIRNPMDYDKKKTKKKVKDLSDFMKISKPNISSRNSGNNLAISNDNPEIDKINMYLIIFKISELKQPL